MNSKKGLTEADWAMSMGIFLIYLAWFFVVIKPAFIPETKESLPFSQLKESFFGFAGWQINRTPLIIRSNVTNAYEPIILDFPFSGNAGNYYLADDYFSVDEGKIFFITSLSSQPYANTKLEYLYHSTSNYTLPPLSSDLASSGESVSTDDFVATFADSLLQQAFFRNSLKIKSYSIEVDGSPIGTTNTNHFYNKIISKHKIMTPSLNHSAYVFLRNPRIYNLMKSKTTKHISISAELDKYPEFYMNPSAEGHINYNQTGCSSYTADFIDFFDSNEGIAFVFDHDADIELCHSGTLEVTASYDFKGDSEYKIIFHDRQTDAAEFIQPYSAVWGEDEVMEGLSAERLFNLEKTNYTYLAGALEYGYDFRITVMNSTKDTLYGFGIEPPQRVTTSGRTYNTMMLDKHGNQSQASVAFISW